MDSNQTFATVSPSNTIYLDELSFTTQPFDKMGAYTMGDESPASIPPAARLSAPLDLKDVES